MGGGGHSKVIIDMVERAGKFEIQGILDDFKSIDENILGYSVFRELKCDFDINIVVGIGDNFRRSEIVNKLRIQYSNCRFPSVIHPSAQIGSDVYIGEGTVVMPGVVINSGSTIGKFCIINTSSSVDHDCVLGNYASIAPGATLGGCVKVGEFSAVSLGAKVIHSIRIGDHTVVGAGALVLSDIPERVVAFGSPCEVRNVRRMGEAYL